MKTSNIIKAGVFTLFTVTLFAIGTTKVFADTEHCAEWHDMAKTIMEVRQSGAPIAEVVEAAKETPSIQREVTAIIAAAYDVALQKDKENKLTVTTEFANQIFMICYRNNVEDI